MSDATHSATLGSNADLFREEAARARRYAAAMTDKTIAVRLTVIAELYEKLACGQDPGPTDRD